MSVPGTNQVQFSTAGGTFSVDVVTDPNGAPADVLDIDLGFTVSGSVVLPNWLVGTGQVCVYAAEVGGAFNGSIGCTKLTFTRPTPPAEPNTTRYPWSIAVAPNALPDPQPNSSQVYNLVAVFVFEDQLTDIGAFVDMGKYMID